MALKTLARSATKNIARMNSTEGTDSHITINKMLSGRTRLEIISTSVWCIIQRNIIEKEDFDKIRLHLVQPKMVLRKFPVGKFLSGYSVPVDLEHNFIDQ